MNYVLNLFLSILCTNIILICIFACSERVSVFSIVSPIFFSLSFNPNLLFLHAAINAIPIIVISYTYSVVVAPLVFWVLFFISLIC